MVAVFLVDNRAVMHRGLVDSLRVEALHGTLSRLPTERQGTRTQ